MNDEPLIHWGIPGMRWGHRRMSKSPLTSKKANQWMDKHQREQRLRDLGSENPVKISTGKKIIAGLLISGFGMLLVKNIKG